MVDTQIREFADRLYRAEKDLTVIPPLTDEVSDMAIDLAYEIQLLNVEKKRGQGDRVVGHKIGLTSKPMQAMLGVNEPDFGHLFASMHYQSGDVVDYPLIQPRVEPELAFVLQADLDGPQIGVQDVLQATRFVLPAVEIIDSRIADWKIKLADTIADNASSGCFVLSDTVTAVDQANLTTAGAILKINGEIVETGAGAAVIGNPARAVAWLANKLSSLGTTLKKGDIILSGAVSRAVNVRAGDRVSLSFGPLGRVEFTMQAN
ncbi:2-keto-4-pentenoate hydratase [Alicyclobacillus acidoterrestris]|uniref:2-keto-4-pentenoate hydratase n=1 Tax=Alicyclobacillus suci TaxID=2816080 RepID=UPI001193DE7E|nr:2-keto-4-pentenoate hydratase [Alicyclobacillus suci]GEO25216.1 2-keto-4-pentenoate hydratase [Alicyclobacillus acidoterrestris]